MDILAALRKEESKLEHTLNGIRGAISALNGSGSKSQTTPTGVTRKRTMSAAARARISEATRARWAKFRAEKKKRGK